MSQAYSTGYSVTGESASSSDASTGHTWSTDDKTIDSRTGPAARYAPSGCSGVGTEFSCTSAEADALAGTRAAPRDK